MVHGIKKFAKNIFAGVLHTKLHHGEVVLDVGLKGWVEILCLYGKQVHAEVCRSTPRALILLQSREN